MPCTAWAVKGGTRCYFHANPEKVSELGRLKEKKRVGAGGSVQEIRSDGTVLHLLHRLPLPRHPQAAGLALDSELPSQRAGNLESAGAFTLPPKPKKKKKKEEEEIRDHAHVPSRRPCGDARLAYPLHSPDPNMLWFGLKRLDVPEK